MTAAFNLRTARHLGGAHDDGDQREPGPVDSGTVSFARTGVFIIPIPAGASTASDAAVNLASQSRVRNSKPSA
jgi:hypothetical protein